MYQTIYDVDFLAKKKSMKKYPRKYETVLLYRNTIYCYVLNI